MNIFKAILLGLIQGLTEFLPVSSSGHLVIFSHLLKTNVETSAFFDVLLHVGTLAAVFVVFWKDVKSFFVELVRLIAACFRWLRNREPIRMYLERKMCLMVIAASIPTALIGLIVKKFLEDLFLSSLVAVGISLLITSALLLLSKKIPDGRKTGREMKWYDGIFIGIVQGIATVPGISRAGSTVVAGEFCGLDKDFAFRFSFLMSIPAIIGAALLELFNITAKDAANFGPYFIGMIVAGLSGYFALKWLRRMVISHKFHYFGYYCLAAGLITIIAGLVM